MLAVRTIDVALRAFAREAPGAREAGGGRACATARALTAAVWLIAAATLITAAPAAGQVVAPSVLVGTVADSAGQAIDGAEVTASRPGITGEHTTTTGEDGRFILPRLPPGDYHVRVRSFGYRDLERAASLAPGATVVLDLVLATDAFAVDEVRVEVAANPRFDRTRTGTGTTLTAEAIRAVPTVERSLERLAELSPVVSSTRGGGLSISGQNARYNAVMIDGAMHQDHFGATSSGVPGSEARARALPLDAVEDFEVEAAPFDVRRSGFTGGLLNAVTRRGTDAWHGSLGVDYRNERFFGELVVDGADLTPASYRKQVLTGTLGGPILRDRLHVFLAAEVDSRLEPPLGYSLGPGTSTVHTRVDADSAASLATILEDVYDLEGGEPGAYDLDNLSGNAFARVDWRIGPDHELTSHLNLVSASRDVPANRTPVGAYELSSSGYAVESTTIGAMARLKSRLSPALENELTLNLQRTRDRREPAARFPQIDVEVRSELTRGELDGYLLQRTLRAGAGYMDQRSDLGQTILQLSDALSWERGPLTTTFGAGIDLYRFSHDVLPGALGYYRFDSLDELRANTPSYYERRVLQEGAPEGPVRFTVAQPSALVQNEHIFPDGLIMYYGIRADVPLFLTEPDHNPAIQDAFDRRTDRLPSGHFLISPRVGINWQSDRKYMTQIRGGGGVFTGRLPYVWLADAYARTGLRTEVLSCSGFTAPDLQAGTAPATCAGSIPGDRAANVLVFDPDFRVPREIKTSLAVDQRLPFGLIASAEVLLVQTLSQVVIRDLNLDPAGAKDRRYLTIAGQRTQFGDPILPTGYAQRRLLEGYAHVLEMGNETSSGFAHSVTLGLEGRFGDHVTLGGSYSFNHSDDTQSLTWGDALLNYATSPATRDPNERARRTSAFNRPWKAVASARITLPDSWTGGTELSVVYIGEAGTPYSYVYGGDVNGDGYPGPGIQIDESNDLINVPLDVGVLNASPATWNLLGQLFEREPCLADARGTIVRRNACRGPASHRVDVRLAQPLRFGRYRMDVTASLLNLLNFLDPSWGRVIDVPPLVPVLALHGRLLEKLPPDGRPNPNAPLGLRYVGPLEWDAEQQRSTAGLPHSVLVPESQWQAQIGMKLSF